jgi:hypothetical protein
MTGTEIVLETVSYSPFVHLAQLLAREYFIEFTRRQTCKLYIMLLVRAALDMSREVLSAVQRVKLTSNVT